MRRFLWVVVGWLLTASASAAPVKWEYHEMTFHAWPAPAQVYLDDPTSPIYLGTTELPTHVPLRPGQDTFRLRITKRGCRTCTMLLTREQMAGDVTVPALQPLNVGWSVYWAARMHPIPMLLGVLAVIGVVALVIRLERGVRATRRKQQALQAIPPSATRAGTRIGKWVLVEKLGEGGMAEVYRAVPEATFPDGEAVALKLSKSQDHWEDRARFEREIRISRELHHPHIVHLIDWGDHEGMQFFVMETVQGSTLARILRKQGPLTLGEFRRIFQDILDAVHFAHQRGLIHRDLKPSNIMMTDQGHIKVMDFGLARTPRPPEPQAPSVPAPQGTQLTTAGVTPGTPHYMAPEYLLTGQFDARADQYALGVTAYELLVGAPPFDAEHTDALFFQHVRLDAVPLSQVRVEVPPALSDLIARMMAKTPEDRYSSLAEVRQSLEAMALPIR